MTGCQLPSYKPFDARMKQRCGATKGLKMERMATGGQWWRDSDRKTKWRHCAQIWWLADACRASCCWTIC